MNMYAKALGIIVGSHVVRWAAEYAYFTQCAGFWNSIFAWNSPTCRGLRWTADSVMTNIVVIASGYGSTVIQALASR
jgi:hypothetical protein